MTDKRIEIIPRIHGKRTTDGKFSEPDIYWILEKWLERHPEVKGREREIRIVRGQWHTRDGVPTDVICASILASEDLPSYDPAADVDLYEFFLADEWQGD